MHNDLCLARRSGRLSYFVAGSYACAYLSNSVLVHCSSLATLKNLTITQLTFYFSSMSLLTISLKQHFFFSLDFFHFLTSFRHFNGVKELQRIKSLFGNILNCSFRPRYGQLFMLYRFLVDLFSRRRSLT